MPRAPRLDTEGALHHVMARGIEKQDIFFSDEDREDLLERLASVFKESGVGLFAWCLMPNHFHLLIRTGSERISSVMRRVLTGYAVSVNRRRHRVGHLFQNRYKSILVEEDLYFKELVRYIHLNPVRAGIVRSLGELECWQWTGHSVVMERRVASWQDVSYLLEQFNQEPAVAREEYLRFVFEGVRQGCLPELSGGGLLRSIGGLQMLEGHRRGRERWAFDERVLGSSEFVQKVALGSVPEENCFPRHPVHRDGFLVKLIAVVGRRLGVGDEVLRSGCRIRSVSAARAAIGWIAVLQCGMPASLVGRFVGVSGVSVLKALERGEAVVRAQKLDVKDILRESK